MLEAARAAGLTNSQKGGTRIVLEVRPSCHARNEGGRIPNAFSLALTVRAFFISLVDWTSIILSKSLAALSKTGPNRLGHPTSFYL